MCTDQELLLALGITEYHRAITHLDALRSAGVVVSRVTEQQLTNELTELVKQWPGVEDYNEMLLPTYLNSVARWTAEHLKEMDDLLTRRGLT